jgi:hypothetical protein
MRREDGVAELILGLVLGIGVGLGVIVLVAAVLFDIFPV